MRRKLKSCQRPNGWKLFAQYCPDLSDRNPCTGQINWTKWSIPELYEESRNQEKEWKLRICGYEPYWQPSAPAWYRRERNRQLRTRQKAVLNKAIQEDDWDNFILPRGRNDINWLWW